MVNLQEFEGFRGNFWFAQCL